MCEDSNLSILLSFKFFSRWYIAYIWTWHCFEVFLSFFCFCVHTWCVWVPVCMCCDACGGQGHFSTVGSHCALLQHALLLEGTYSSLTSHLALGSQMHATTSGLLHAKSGDWGLNSSPQTWVASAFIHWAISPTPWHILYVENVLLLFINFDWFSIKSWVYFFLQVICIKIILFIPFYVMWLSFFSCLIAISMTWDTMLNRSGKRGHPWLIHDLRENLSDFDLIIWACCRVLTCALYRVEKVSFYF